MAQNIQILLETMLRCGGNCSGCALSSIEKTSKSSIDWIFFEEKIKLVNNILEEKKQEEIESISLFLGQGDHFLLSEAEIEKFMFYCSKIIPEDLKHKTVILITASAIGKYIATKNKMDKIFDLSIKYKMPFFIQVVFDPKKNMEQSFKETYIKNILYFKEKCGMTELTINLGKDILENISPQNFHNLMIEYNFLHIEINWVMNNQTHSMWLKNYKEMFNWLKELLILNAKNHKYEINFIPFLARAFELKNVSNINLLKHISTGLQENIYIDNHGNINLGQAGLVSNLIPLNQRLKKIENIIRNLKEVKIVADKSATNILSKLLRKENCGKCKYNFICSQIGSSSWFDFDSENIYNPLIL